MKILNILSQFYKNLLRRRRISVINTQKQREEWYTHISPVGIATTIVFTILSIFAIVFLLAGYTSLFNIFPEYKSQNDRSRQELIESLIRIDSIETRLLNMEAFSDNISLIMDGKSPISHNVVERDSSGTTSRSIESNNLDSLLHAQMNSSDRYSLNYPTQREMELKMGNINHTAPIEGIVTEKYDLSKGNFGVKIASQPKAMVYASDSGVVVNSLWSPEFGYMVEILHSKGDLTIYKNLSLSLTEKGQSVERGEVIGYNGENLRDGAQARLFSFELWIAGKPVNPQLYINF